METRKNKNLKKRNNHYLWIGFAVDTDYVTGTRIWVGVCAVGVKRTGILHTNGYELETGCFIYSFCLIGSENNFFILDSWWNVDLWGPIDPKRDHLYMRVFDFHFQVHSTNSGCPLGATKGDTGRCHSQSDLIVI